MLEKSQCKWEYLQSLEAFQALEHLMLNIFQTITCEKYFIHARCAFKRSLFNVCDLIVAKVSKQKWLKQIFETISNNKGTKQCVWSFSFTEQPSPTKPLSASQPGIPKVLKNHHFLIPSSQSDNNTSRKHLCWKVPAQSGMHQGPQKYRNLDVRYYTV